ncbi:MAG: hypothetical protein EXR39_13135 [Betaproteobacteria bacterium]|nr:hypothetical protein [Betaproteobacteria bacterium]
MMQIGTPDQALRRRRELPLPSGATYFKSEFIDAPVVSPVIGGPVCVEGDRTSASTLAPVAFLIEQGPDSVVQSHFHHNDEFQVVVAGSGFIGRNPVSPVSVHYAGGYTGYGPVVAGPDGVSYFTLRPRYEAGALYLPDDRAAMKRGPKRHFRTPAITIRSDGDRQHASATTFETVIPLAADGLMVSVACLPARGACTAPDRSHGSGQYWLVLGGSLVHAGTLLAERSVLFVAGELPQSLIVAGAGGLDLLVLQFPRLLYSDRVTHNITG